MDFTCELDEHAVLIRDLKMSGIIKDHRKGLTTHKNTFQANQFVDWLVKEKSFDGKVLADFFVDWFKAYLY